MSTATRRSSTRVRDVAARSPPRTPTRSTAKAGSRVRRSTRCARSRAVGRAARGARWRRGQFRALARGVHRARPTLRVQRDGFRDAPDQGDHARAAPRRGSVVQRLPRTRRRRAAARRVGDVGDRHRAATWAARSPHSAHPSEGMSAFEKQAPTVSYGAHADDFFITLRRSPDAEPGDQVVALGLERAGRARARRRRGTRSECAAPAPRAS